MILNNAMFLKGIEKAWMCTRSALHPTLKLASNLVPTVLLHSGTMALACAVKHVFPTIDCAPSVQISTHCFQLRPFAAMCRSVSLKISYSAVWVGKGLRMSISSSTWFLYVTKQKICLINLNSILQLILKSSQNCTIWKWNFFLTFKWYHQAHMKLCLLCKVWWDFQQSYGLHYS
jgi:hypothetical protein